jgi:Leucine-rich repeat (LRR) protein
MSSLLNFSGLKTALATLVMGAILNSCGSKGANNPEAEVSQVAAPKGSFLELCRQSTVGGPGPKIANTIGRMRQAAQLDGGARSGKCDDVAEALSKMTVLSLGRSAIEDVSPIARVKNLEILLLAENNIRDLSPLLSMPNLIDVNVDRNRFKLTCPFRDKSICTGID